jgi:alpha-beta hydrolase superfamily lysophospholipase
VNRQLVLYLNTDVLDPASIKVFVDANPVEDSKSLLELADEIAAQSFFRSRQSSYLGAGRKPIADESQRGKAFDVFLAHNSEDRVFVEAMADELRKRGLRPWLDWEQIRPGQSFQEGIQEAVQNVKSVAILIGSHGLGKWQAWELRASITLCVSRGVPVIPVLLPGVTSVPASVPLLAELNWVRFIRSVEEEESIDRLVWGISGQRPEAHVPGATGRPSSMPPTGTSLSRPPLGEGGQPGRSGKVLVGLHGIRTHAAWARALYEVASEDAWQVRMDRWSFGYFSLLQFILPSSRTAKVRWFRQVYTQETQNRKILLDEGQYPSIVAHSFGTYILGNALLRYDWLAFNKVILCGSILPTDFPWDKLIERGQVQAVRNEFGVRDVWTRLARWFVAGTGPSGHRGFACSHERLEQEEFAYEHSEYFDKGHMEAKWLPFLNRHLPLTPRLKTAGRGAGNRRRTASP